jgi:hypothetical protein
VLIVSILSLLAAGCEGTCETLRRVEVWKQHTFFAPNEPVVFAPAGEPTCGAPAEPTCGMAEPGCGLAETGCGSTADAMEQPATTVGLPVTPGPVETTSPEVINGVLEQP